MILSKICSNSSDVSFNLKIMMMFQDQTNKNSI